MKETRIQDRYIVEYTEAEWNFRDRNEECDKAVNVARSEGKRYADILVRPDEFFSDLERPLNITMDLLMMQAHDKAYPGIEAFKEIQGANAAYAERNMLVALLARHYPSGIKRTAITDWDPAWHNCVYIDIPKVGQLSWHYHDNEAYLFDGLPEYTGNYDGHTTPDKYYRMLKWSFLQDLTRG